MVHLATYCLSQNQVLSPQVKGRTDSGRAGRSVCGGEQWFEWMIWTLCLSDMMGLIFFFFFTLPRNKCICSVICYQGKCYASLFIFTSQMTVFGNSLYARFEIKTEVLCFDNRCTWSKYICNIDEHFCQIISYAMYLVNIFSRITFVYNIPNSLQSLKKKQLVNGSDVLLGWGLSKSPHN